MTDVAYNAGLDVLGNGSWTGDTYKWMLLKGTGYTPNKDHHFVADLTPASNECGQAGYTRQTVAGKTRTVDNTNDRITYDATTDPAFGSIAAGDNITGLVLFKFVTNDADSILIGYYALTSTPTDGNPFVVFLNAAGVAYDDQGA